MDIGLGVYDVFSRIVPGGFYLFVLYQFVVAIGWVKFDWATLKDIGLVPSIGLLLVAYILGTGMDFFGSIWHRRFMEGRMINRLEEFKKKNPEWNFDFEANDLHILRAYIRIHNLDVANVIDRIDAISIMLRNISFGLIILAISEIIQSINTMNAMHVLLFVLLAFLSIAIAIQARDLQDWYYDGIFQTILAFRLDLDERVRSVKTRAKGKNAK